MICNPLCGEPPASGERVCSMGARGGTTRADANYVAVWQMQKIFALIYATRYYTSELGWFIFF